MDELRGRFEGINDLAAPDLWTEIRQRADALDAAPATRRIRAARTVTGTPRRGRATGPAIRPLTVLLIVVALVIAAIVGTLAAGAWRPEEPLLAIDPSIPAPIATVTTETASPASAPRGVWTTTAPMASSGFLQAAVLLVDGTVLVTGGRNNTDSPAHSLAATEIYRPATRTWTPAANMVAGRSAHTATVLPDGRVLVAGGFDDWAALDSAELYDPATGSWTTTGAMHEARGYHTATLLRDGRVLVAGGRSNSSSTGHALSSAELYDPKSGSWTTTGSMRWARTFHTATLLPDGRVLVAGTGITGDRVDLAATAEIYDPATGAWTPTGRMTVARASHAAALLPTGAVLVVGGDDSVARAFQAGSGPVLRSAELFDPATGSWRATADMGHAHALATATALLDGRVLVVGGDATGHGPAYGTSTYDTHAGSATAELFDATSGTWTSQGALGQERELQIAVALPSGQVLVAGGSTAGAALGSAETYDEVGGR